MNLNFQSTLEGEYRIVVNRDGEDFYDTGWFKNMILDQGLNRLGNSTSVQPMAYVHLGSGNTTPAASQTGLTTFLTSSVYSPASASAVVNEGAPNYSTLMTYTYPFARGAIIGNVSEIGVGWSNTGNTLFSRALILDGSSNPTTIVATAVDQITVYYRLRVIPPVVDTTGSLIISGTTYAYTLRLANAATFCNSSQVFGSYSFPGAYGMIAYPSGSALGAIDGAPSGTASAQVNSGSMAAYTAGTFYRDCTFSFAVGDGNVVGGIQALQLIFGTAAQQTIKFQMRFGTVISKDNTKTFSITVRFTWARA